MAEVRHIMALSGGADYTAMALWMRESRPDLDMTYLKDLRVRFERGDKPRGIAEDGTTKVGKCRACSV